MDATDASGVRYELWGDPVPTVDTDPSDDTAPVVDTSDEDLSPPTYVSDQNVAGEGLPTPDDLTDPVITFDLDGEPDYQPAFTLDDTHYTKYNTELKNRYLSWLQETKGIKVDPSKMYAAFDVFNSVLRKAFRSAENLTVEFSVTTQRNKVDVSIITKYTDGTDPRKEFFTDVRALGSYQGYRLGYFIDSQKQVWLCYKRDVIISTIKLSDYENHVVEPVFAEAHRRMVGVRNVLRT